MPKKKPTLTRQKKKLWKLVARSIKERDCYQCWHCKKRDNGSAVHCSHILPKGQYPRYEFEEWNLKTLCLHCHLNWWHKNPLEAADWFRQSHPTKYKQVLKYAIDYQNKKSYTYKEVLKLIKEYEGPIVW